MAKGKKRRFDGQLQEEKNLSVLVDLVVDPSTPPKTQVKILNRLVAAKRDRTFFDLLLDENLDLGECPHCGHTNNWLTPEDQLNRRNIVTAYRDPRVDPYPSEEKCPRYQQACGKKKVTC